MRRVIKHIAHAPLRAIGAGLIFGAVGFLVWYGVALQTSTPPVFIPDRSDSFDLQRAYWQTRVETLGGTAAYAEFSRFASGNSVIDRHQLAHAFGEGLYAVDGTQGVLVCDAQFSYGCFHVVLGKTIADSGLSEVAQFDRACRGSNLKGPAACEHGIGHGIVAYLGYQRDALDMSLRTCDTLAEPNAALGCHSGVFMEYNMRTMLGASATSRQLVEGDLFAPCNTLVSKYRSTCAFWQPQWWMYGVYGVEEPDEAMYRKLGGLCDRAGSTDMVRSCYEGLGYVTPESTGYSPALSALLCKASTTSVLGQLYCTAFAAYVIGSDQTRAEGRRTCSSFANPSLLYCLDYADGKANMFVPSKLPVTEHV